MPLRQFSLENFHRSLEEQRQKQDLSWPELAREINRPFAGTTSIPIHSGTLRDMCRKTSVTSAVVLQTLRWLEKAPEDFLVPPCDDPSVDTRLPRVGHDQILRLDTVALHAALDAQREQQALSWAQVARQLPGFRPAMLTNLAKGPLIGFPRVMLLTQWLHRPLAQFVRARSR